MAMPRSNFDCTADGCDMPAKCAQLCHMHYYRMRRHGSLEPPLDLAHTCRTCLSGRRDIADPLLLAGEPSASVAKRIGVSRWSVDRHRRNCLGWMQGAGVGRRCSVCIADDIEAIDKDTAEWAATRRRGIHGTIRLDDLADKWGFDQSLFRAHVYRHFGNEARARRLARADISRLEAVRAMSHGTPTPPLTSDNT